MEDTEKTEVNEMPDLEDFSEVTESSDVLQDASPKAVRFAILGAGQAGGKLAETMWGLGYRRVLCINTASQDLSSLKVPEENKYALPGYDGTGKDMSVGQKAAKEFDEEIIQKMHGCWKKGVEHVLICLGSGGGTGSGSAPVLIECAKEYLKTIQVEEPRELKVGVMVALPKQTEKGVAQRNALESIRQLIALAEEKKISPLVIVDNGQIHKLLPGMSVSEFWTRANKSICGLFDVFNRLAARNDGDPQFDVQEYRKLLQGGIMTLGQMKVKNWEKTTDLADTVRANLKRGLLAEGFDLKKATQAAAIMTAQKEILDQLKEETVDMAYDALGRLCNDKEVAVHRGMYTDAREGLYVYAAVSGLGAPEQRLKEIANLAGLEYP